MSQLEDIKKEIRELKKQKAEIENRIKSFPWYIKLIILVFGDDEIVFPDDAEETVNFVLDRLLKREKTILLMRVKENKTLAECSNELRVSRERVRQIEAKAYRKLRHPTRSRILLNGIKKFKHMEEDAQKSLREKFADYKNVSIECVDLSIRAFNCLKRANINTAQDLYVYINGDKDRLLKIRNLGSKAQQEICEKFNIQ